MEQRVKERLTGAIVLVALVVIVVPELLTGPRRPPAAGPATRSVTLELGEDAHRVPQAPAPVASAAASVSPAPTLDAPAAPVTAPPAPPAQDKPSAAPNAPPEPEVEANAGGWMVQLGSFERRDNAQRLVQELRHKGYTAFQSEFHGSGRVLYRVRVGPEQDRARAEALAARLVREGHPGKVTAQP
jgi:DedD protein